jgi:hypothetical protein
MKITAITTVSHNVGDDFVREGIVYLLKQIVPNVEIWQIHKHQPITARPAMEWLYLSGISTFLDRLPGSSKLNLLGLLDRSLPLNGRTDKILNCDLVVQCGAPVYWLHGDHSCAQSEWYEPLIRRRWTIVRNRVPFINLAGGSCQQYSSDGKEFADAIETLDFIREFYDSCMLTTLRDHLANEILRLAGRVAPVLPCPSIFARFNLGIPTDLPQYVALNFMPKGGHYRFGSADGKLSWEQTFVAFFKSLPSTEKYIFVCHDHAELTEAKRLFPEYPTFYSKNHGDYLRFYAKVKFGIFNRVHAAFALGSFGRPSFVIGNDSRARMSEMIGLRNAFVGDVTAQSMLTEFEQLGQTWRTYQPIMDAIQTDTKEQYRKLLEVRCGDKLGAADAKE